MLLYDLKSKLYNQVQYFYEGITAMFRIGHNERSMIEEPTW